MHPFYALISAAPNGLWELVPQNTATEPFVLSPNAAAENIRILGADVCRRRRKMPFLHKIMILYRRAQQLPLGWRFPETSIRTTPKFMHQSVQPYCLRVGYEPLGIVVMRHFHLQKNAVVALRSKNCPETSPESIFITNLQHRIAYGMELLKHSPYLQFLFRLHACME